VTDEHTDEHEVLEGELLPADDPGAEVRIADPRQSVVDELYVEWIAKQRSHNTREAYARDWDRWIGWLDEHVELTPLEVRGVHAALYARWLESTPVRGGRVPAPATVARRLAAVSSFYDLAVKREVLLRNPMDYVDRPEIDSSASTTSWLTLDEARRVTRAAFGLVAQARGADTRRAADRDSVIVAVMLTTGARVSEVCGMRLEKLGYQNGERVINVLRKGGVWQPMPLGPAAELIDRRLVGRQGQEGWLFSTRSGGQVRRSWVFSVIRKVAIAAAIPDPARLTPHSLRHTFATLALDRGCSLDHLQVALNHSDPRTTRRYDHNRLRIKMSPVHDIGRALLADHPDQEERLF
jgi:site-specific recombinase XerD